jgi:hypothetical protein
VTLFGVFKPHRTYELPFRDEKAAVKFIRKGYHGLNQTIMESNILGAFQALTFDFDTGTEPIDFYSMRTM